jgi:hypothetical protein
VWRSLHAISALFVRSMCELTARLPKDRSWAGSRACRVRGRGATVASIPCGRIQRPPPPWRAVVEERRGEQRSAGLWPALGSSIPRNPAKSGTPPGRGSQRKGFYYCHRLSRAVHHVSSDSLASEPPVRRNVSLRAASDSSDSFEGQLHLHEADDLAAVVSQVPSRSLSTSRSHVTRPSICGSNTPSFIPLVTTPPRRSIVPSDEWRSPSCRPPSRLTALTPPGLCTH